MKVYLPIAALAALLLAACAGPPAPAPSPTAAPTASAPTAAAPTAASTPAPPAGALQLPAPLYLLQAGQIARIKADGSSRAVLTAERAPFPGVEPIAEFAVAPDGGLAYIVGDAELDRLVLADASGQGATTIYGQQGHELSDLVFTPDGQALTLRLLNNRTPPDTPSGLYRLPLAGGSPELLRTDDTTDNLADPARTVSGYRPVAFAPAGDRLLLQVFSLYYEDCGLGLSDPAGGEVTRIALPEGQSVYCGEESWTADGTAVLFLAGTLDGEGAGPRLWRADATTGAAEPLMAEGSFARAPLGMPGGAVRLFAADLIRDAGGATMGATFTPAELAAPGAAPQGLAPPFDQYLNGALWAPDGGGVVADLSNEGEPTALVWLPIGGEPVDLPIAQGAITQLAWGTGQ